MKRILSIALLVSYGACWAAGDSTLYYRAMDVNGWLVINVRQGGDVVAYKTNVKYNSIRRNFVHTYNSLQVKTQPDSAILRDLSRDLLDPVMSYVSKINKICFIIDESQITYAFDLLMLDNHYLFLSREVVYQFSGVVIKRTSGPDLTGSSGIIIRDEETDPENACKVVADLFPHSRSYQIDSIRVNELQQQHPDFLLISAHGFVDQASQHIRFGSTNLLPAGLTQTRTNLIYFDACDIGISLDFIKVATAGGTRFYLGPIIKNEAGHSSTRTIIEFFGNLKAGKSASASLYLTRKSVYEMSFGSDPGLRLWYSFPMRLYELN